jgi:hypothetical protein
VVSGAPVAHHPQCCSLEGKNFSTRVDQDVLTLCPAGRLPTRSARSRCSGVRSSRSFRVSVCAILVLLAFVLQFMYDRYMAKSTISVTQKRRPGRPATGHDPARSVRLSDEIIDRIEKWSMRQADKPPRSEAIRRLVERGLAAEPIAPKRGRAK